MLWEQPIQTSGTVLTGPTLPWISVFVGYTIGWETERFYQTPDPNDS